MKESVGAVQVGSGFIERLFDGYLPKMAIAGLVVFGLLQVVSAADDDIDIVEKRRLTGIANRLDQILAASQVEPLAEGEFRVRLAFEADVDLDLFVTDPVQESVYFANSPTHSGGELIKDMRCTDPAPRVEEVIFHKAPAGRYRIGVDFPERCDEKELSTGLVVYAETKSDRQSRRRSIAPGKFVPIVLEYDFQP